MGGLIHSHCSMPDLSPIHVTSTITMSILGRAHGLLLQAAAVIGIPPNTSPLRLIVSVHISMQANSTFSHTVHSYTHIQIHIYKCEGYYGINAYYTAKGFSCLLSSSDVFFTFPSVLFFPLQIMERVYNGLKIYLAKPITCMPHWILYNAQSKQGNCTSKKVFDLFSNEAISKVEQLFITKECTFLLHKTLEC